MIKVLGSIEDFRVNPAHWHQYSVLDPKEIVSKLSSSWTGSAKIMLSMIFIQSKRFSVQRFCALSMYTVDVDAVVAAAELDAGADVALAGAVVHVDSVWQCGWCRLWDAWTSGRTCVFC